MPHVSRASQRGIAVFMAALLLIALAYYFSIWFIPFWFPTSEAYSLLLLAWAVSVYRRILQMKVRRSFILGAGLLISMFLLRLWRYNMASAVSPLSRYLWYAYYLPMTAVPLAAFAAAVHMGRAEDERAPRYLRLLRLLWLLLAACIMANDLHGWMFRITELREDSLRYSHGPLYFLSFGWIGLVSLASFAVLIRRCRLSQCRRLWFVPALAALPGFGLLLWYLAEGGSAPELLGHKLYNFQEAYAILFVFVWESCIQIGLILSNTDYAAIFALSPLAAFITDEDGRVLLRSAGADLPSPEQLAGARLSPLSVDGDHVLHSHPIHDGAVYWIEDLSSVNEINRKIASAIEYLQDEQSLLMEEARIKSERASYETQNRLYDSLSPLVRPQLAAARRLLEEATEDEADFRERLTLAMVLCVYAKRRVNLAILASRSGRLPVEELKLAIRETLEYLRLREVVCSLECLGAEETLPAGDLLLVYDFFASVVEAALPGLSALFVLLHCREDFGIDLSMGTPSGQLAGHWRLRQRESSGAVMTLSEDEGLAFARLRLERGAEK